MSLRFFSIGVVALHALALLGGCGGDGGTGGGGGDGGSPAASPSAKFAAAYAEAVCGATASCCSIAGAAADVDACKKSIGAQIEADAAKAAELGVELVAGATDPCIQQMSAALALCGAPVEQARGSAEALDRARRACEDVFPGAKQEGEPCSSAVECASAENAVRGCGYDGSAMTCLQIPISVLVAKGQPCHASSDDVPPGETQATCGGPEHLYCKSGICTKRAPAGASCADSQVECDSHFCSNDVCKNGQAAVGQSCDPLACSVATFAQCVCVPGAECEGLKACIAANGQYGEACSDSATCDADASPSLDCFHGKCAFRAQEEAIDAWCAN